MFEHRPFRSGSACLITATPALVVTVVTPRAGTICLFHASTYEVQAGPHARPRAQPQQADRDWLSATAHCLCPERRLERQTLA